MMTSKAYQLDLPDVRSSGVVFASPHSGRDYSWAFLRKTVLDERTVRSSEDAFVDMLFDAAPSFGAPLLTARAPRAFLDLNRSSEELDPAVIEGVSKSGHNPRVTSGLGVIPRVVANGRSIYNGKLTEADAQRRITDIWHPYHEALQQLMNESLALFGEAILIDCHSMPHEALENISYPGGKRPEIVLGDRFGAAASRDVSDRVEAAFASAGFVVIRNAPFAGAYMTQHYGRPSRNQHVIQVEIDRSIYMDEKAIRPSQNFHHIRRIMRDVISELVDMSTDRIPLVAE
jgi:N-formylglutamate deformylase